jgi:hypothetical protein
LDTPLHVSKVIFAPLAGLEMQVTQIFLLFFPNSFFFVYRVGTPTIPYLYSVIHFSSQQYSLSPSCSIHLCLADTAVLLRASEMKTHSASHTHQLRELANGKAEQTAELSIKEARFPSSTRYSNILFDPWLKNCKLS